MNGELKPARSHLFATIVAAIGAFLIVGALIWITVRVTRPAPVGQARAQERKSASRQLRQDEAQVLRVLPPQRGDALVEHGSGIRAANHPCAAP